MVSGHMHGAPEFCGPNAVGVGGPRSRVYDRAMPATSRVLPCLVALMSCRPVAPSTGPEDAPTHDPTAVPAVPPIGVIVASIVPIAPGGVAIDIEDIGAPIDACKAAGWPATLPEAQARALPEHAIGSHAIVVHPGGNTEVTIAGIECQAPGDIDGPIASLDLLAAAPEGPPDPRIPAAMRGRFPGRPHLAVLGATVARDARLVEPVAIDLTTAPAVRDAVTRRAAAIAEARRAACVAEGVVEGVPDAAAIAQAIPEVVASANVTPIRDGARMLHFAVLQHPAVVFGCQGQQEQIGVLLDPAGDVLLELVSNNGIEVQWITDLDGDGVQEALVDMQWMEDGMHDVGVVHGDDAAWVRTIVWSADTP